MKTRTFNLYWLTGDIDEVSGPDLGNQKDTLASAMNNAGIGGGALAALDYWKETTKPEPSIEQLLEWEEEGGCEATDGCWVEPDGQCEHGHRSWLLEMGLI